MNGLSEASPIMMSVEEGEAGAAKTAAAIKPAMIFRLIFILTVLWWSSKMYLWWNVDNGVGVSDEEGRESKCVL